MNGKPDMRERPREVVDWRGLGRLTIVGAGAIFLAAILATILRDVDGLGDIAITLISLPFALFAVVGNAVSGWNWTAFAVGTLVVWGLLQFDKEFKRLDREIRALRIAVERAGNARDEQASRFSNELRDLRKRLGESGA